MLALLWLSLLSAPPAGARQPTPAIQIAVTADHWLMHSYEVLGLEGDWHVFEQPRGWPPTLDGPGWSTLESVMARLKARARADDAPLSALAALRADDLLPLERLFGPVYLLGQAEFTPGAAVVDSTNGPAWLPIGFSRTACWADGHPDERGKIDWDAGDGALSGLALDLMFHGPPRPCHEARLMLRPGEAAVGWRERWVRDRCSAPPALSPFADFTVATAAAPIGERCRQANLAASAGIVWAELIAGLAWLHAQGSPVVTLSVELPRD